MHIFPKMRNIMMVIGGGAGGIHEGLLLDLLLRPASQPACHF